MTNAVAVERGDPAGSGLLRRPYALTTIGSWSLIFLAAFEAMAVATVMPVITADLHGRAQYSLAFAATLAASVVGMVAAGLWADRRGPARALFAAIAVLALGLAVAGTARTMAVFVAARFVQGLGSGGITVALYVLVAQVYPARLHTRIFGAFASAWVVPSMVGPFLAGVVTDVFGWAWVFLGVVALVGVATALMVPAVRHPGEPDRPRQPPADEPRRPAGRVLRPDGGARRLGAEARRLGAAVLVAVGVVGIGGGAGRDGVLVWAVPLAAVLVVGFAGHGLVPAGTYRARAGLPATVVMCVLSGATFLGTEAYLPLLLHDRYGLPSWLSGITLTAGALGWALASAVQGRVGDRLAHRTAVCTGSALLAVGAVAELVTAASGLPPAFAAVAWAVAGSGMGVLYPRISTLVFAYSAPGEEGMNTSAKSIADAVGGSASVAAAGILFAAAAGVGGSAPFQVVFGFTGAVSLLALPVASRVGRDVDRHPGGSPVGRPGSPDGGERREG